MTVRKKSPIRMAVVAGGILLLFGCLPAPLVQTEPASPSPTLQDPNETNTPSMTLTIMPTSIPSLTPAGEAVIFEDTFIDNRNSWDTDSTLVSLVAGTYTQVVECPSSSASAHCGNFIEIPFDFSGNFRMEIETTLTRSSEGASVMVGFQVRRTDDGYYYINYGITDSSYQMSRVTQTGAFSIIPETQTDLIAPAVGDTNIVGIQINGTEFTPLLNGHAIAPVYDGNIRTAGDAYLVVLVERGHTVELQFDNLVVRTVD